MFMNLFVRLLVHFVMKHNLIRAVMEFFICVKKIQKHFQIQLPKSVWNRIFIPIQILKRCLLN